MSGKGAIEHFCSRRGFSLSLYYSTPLRGEKVKNTQIEEGSLGYTSSSSGVVEKLWRGERERERKRNILFKNEKIGKTVSFLLSSSIFLDPPPQSLPAAEEVLLYCCTRESCGITSTGADADLKTIQGGLVYNLNTGGS